MSNKFIWFAALTLTFSLFTIEPKKSDCDAIFLPFSIALTFVPRELLENVPLGKNIAGIVTNQNVDNVYAFFNKNNKRISSICNVENIDDNKINDGDLVTLQLNEGVIYLGQIEDDEEAIDKYKYV